MKHQYFIFWYIALFLYYGCTPDYTFIEKGSNGNQKFFQYKGTDKGIKDLINYLYEVDNKNPFIVNFQTRFGTPLWDYQSFSGDEWGRTMYIPIQDISQQNAIQTIWCFRFEANTVQYLPLTRQQIEMEKSEEAWMFDYFTQVALGKIPENGIIFVPHTSPVTKIWMEVVTCVDAFAGAGDYIEYKGTHCWSSYTYFPDPQRPPSEIVIPGKGAGSYEGKIPTNAEFYTYPNLEGVYGPSSTLTTGGKIFLNAAFEQVKTRSTHFNKIYKWIVNSRYCIDFKLKAYVVNGDTVPAYFNAADKTIYFKNEDYVQAENLEEELIHAIQYFQFYGETMNADYKNYEFEAKVFRDLAVIFDDNATVLPPYAPTRSDDDPSFENDYLNWLSDIETFKEFTAANEARFFDLCEQWNGKNYHGTCSRHITPKMLKYYFPKKEPN